MNESPQELTEALKANGFVIISNTWHDKALGILHPWDVYQDPFIEIVSPLRRDEHRKFHDLAVNKGQLSPEFLALRDEFTQANLRERLRLFELLDGFYIDRHPPFLVRLAAADFFDGTVLLPQGSQIMRLPEHTAERDQWLKDVRAEMLAFAKFLRKHAAAENKDNKNSKKPRRRLLFFLSHSSAN